MNEQHFLTDTTDYQWLLDHYDLGGRKVFEIGAGHGELTQLLVHRGARCTAVELDASLLLGTTIEADFIIGDAMAIDVSWLDQSWAIICNPPYGLLDHVLRVITDHGITDVIMMVPERRLGDFIQLGYRVRFALTGRVFTPESKGHHYVVGLGMFRE